MKLLILMANTPLYRGGNSGFSRINDLPGGRVWIRGPDYELRFVWFHSDLSIKTCHLTYDSSVAPTTTGFVILGK